MIDYGRQRSNVCPAALEADGESVWVREGIIQVEEEGFSGYEFSMVRYDKNAYITLLSQRNSALEAELTDTQLAVCELYEEVLGNG